MTNTDNTAALFMPRLFDETMRLLLEAQHYFQFKGPHELEHLCMKGRVMYSAEMSRLTLRLSSIMAWVMARRAMHEGQISEEEALAQHRLQFPEICLAERAKVEEYLPTGMTKLLERTHSLYQRIHRLDDAVVA